MSQWELMPITMPPYCSITAPASIYHMSQCMTKPTKWHVRPVKTQISLGIRPVWSESSLSTWRKLGSLATHCAHKKDSDQTGRMPRLIWVFTGRTCYFVFFVMCWFILSCHQWPVIFLPPRQRAVGTNFRISYVGLGWEFDSTSRCKGACPVR